MNDQGEPKRITPQRMIYLALLASLGLNLFFAGWWVGAGLRPPPPHEPGGPLHELEHRLQGRLSPAGMSAVERLIEEIDAGFRHQFDAGDAIRRQLHQILISEPFKPEDFVRTLGELTAGRSSFDSTVAQRVAAFAAGLSPEDRRIFADAILAMPPGPLG
jgi:uncharacterized membrane protein